MDPGLQTFITAILAAITAIAVAYNTYQTSKIAKMAAENKNLNLANQADIQDVVKHTNAMKDELVAEVRTSSLALGAKNQRDLTSSQAAPLNTAPVVIEEMPVPRTPSKADKRRPLGRKRT